jgi:hypothetical protein
MHPVAFVQLPAVVLGATGGSDSSLTEIGSSAGAATAGTVTDDWLEFVALEAPGAVPWAVAVLTTLASAMSEPVMV